MCASLPRARAKSRGSGRREAYGSLMQLPAREGAAELVSAIRAGRVDEVRRIVDTSPELVSGPLGGPFHTRTALHVVADWPGYLPNGPEVVRVLLAAGADPD